MPTQIFLERFVPYFVIILFPTIVQKNEPSIRQADISDTSIPVCGCFQKVSSNVDSEVQIIIMKMSVAITVAFITLMTPMDKNGLMNEEDS